MLMARFAEMGGTAAAIGRRWLRGFDLKSLLFIGLIGFLLIWAFWGNDMAHSRLVRQKSISPPLTHIAEAVNPSGTRIMGPLAIVRQITIILILLLTSGFMFYLFYRHTAKRTLIVLAFAAIMVVMGTVFGIYGPVDAFLAIKFDTLALLLGMAIISGVLEEAGFFARVAYRMYDYSGGSVTRILVLMSLLTYVLSLFANNLSTILVVVPMTLQLASISGFDPKPVVIAEIIASNLGGASTMIGDLPNMLISAETGIGFSRFIVFMTPICLVLLSVMLLYFKTRVGLPGNLHVPQGFSGKMSRPRLTGSQRWTIRRGIFVLCHCTLLLTFSEITSLNVSAIALLAGMSVFLFCGVDRGKVLQRIGFNDLLFFTGLFVVVGALEASGLLEYLSKGMVVLSMDRPWLLCLILMWTSAFMAAFLNAGPTTLLFFPIVMSFTAVPPHHIIWWALSLGVLAGSSATIFGATAGPVAVSLVERFCSKRRVHLMGGDALTYEHFLEIGLPMMLIFLGLSSIYIVLLCVFV